MRKWTKNRLPTTTLTSCSINCLDFSDDLLLVAAGTSQSYIRLWHMEGKPLVSVLPQSATGSRPSSSKQLIGHSAAVFAVSFSPSTSSPETADASTPSTAPKYLLSSSADKSVRLWSLETFTCLVVFKGHDSPVWDVQWGPFGHYFVTCGLDKTTRLWSQDH